MNNHYYPYPVSMPHRNYPTPPVLHSRASWTPFTWVEKYQYAFSGPYNRAMVALTFDDGPDPVFTPVILEKLRKYGVKATFFLLGTNMEKFPELVKQIAAEGHVIGNHSYDHPKLADETDDAYHQQIQKSDALIQTLVGYKPKFFRPPYGSITENQVRWATEQGMMITQWSIDTLDWKGLPAQTITDTVIANVLPGSIILQHNAPGVPLQGTVDALEYIIPQLQMKAVRLVTLPEMFSVTIGR